jgi:hypothetical protein
MIFIIWGRYILRRTLSTGTFLCPHERSQQPYRLRSQNKWLHIMYIPIFPLGSVGDAVHCGGCKTYWKPLVLLPRTAPQPGGQLIPVSGGPSPYATPHATPAIPPVVDGANLLAQVIRGTNIAVVRTVSTDESSRQFAVHSIGQRYSTYDFAALDRDLAHFDLSQLSTQIDAVRPMLDGGDIEAIVTRLTRTAVGGTTELSNDSRHLLLFIGASFHLSTEQTARAIEAGCSVPATSA